jgi:hypothetical protein
MTDINGIEGTNPTTEINNHKRPHMSPRLKAFNEALAILTACKGGWASENPGAEDSERDAVVAALDFVSEKITTVRDAGAQVGTPAKKSYRLVGVKADGSRVAFSVESISLDALTALRAEYTSCLGPFHTQEGANYVADKGGRPTDNRLF